MEGVIRRRSLQMRILTSKAMKIYEVVAFSTFNVIVLIIFFNLVLGGLFLVRDSFGEKKPPIDPRVMRKRGPYFDLQAYTRLSAAEAHALLDEQDVFNSHGFLYESWVQFRAPEFHGRWLNTNSQGFRRTKVPRFSGPSVSKIFVFGGSTTFGYGVPDEHTIPSYMQTILDERYPQKSIVVNNYGQGFYYSSQELQQFLSLLKKQIIPDYAVFIDGLNEVGRIQNKALSFDEPYFTPEVRRLWDAARGTSSNHDRGDEGATSSESWVAQLENLPTEIPMVRFAKSVAARFLSHSTPKRIGDNGFGQQHASPLSDSDAENMAKTVVSIYTTNVSILQAVCREYGITCYFIWQPIPFYKYERRLMRDPRVEVRPYWAKVYSSMEAVHLENFLYLGGMLETVTDKVFVDQVHYNERMNEGIARRICDFLRLDHRT